MHKKKSVGIHNVLKKLNIIESHPPQMVFIGVRFFFVGFFGKTVDFLYKTKRE